MLTITFLLHSVETEISKKRLLPNEVQLILNGILRLSKFSRITAVTKNPAAAGFYKAFSEFRAASYEYLPTTGSVYG